MKKIIVAALCIVMVLSLAACGSKAEPLTVEQVFEAMKNEGLPIGNVIIYDENTDRNGLLGRPDKYIGKGDFEDTTVEFNGYDLSGGTLEVFDSKEACNARYDYLTRDDQYKYKSDYAILRLWYEVPPSEAAKYEEAFHKIADGAPGAVSDPASVTVYDPDGYVERIRNLRDAISENSLSLGHLADYIINYKTALENVNGTYEADKALESALNALAKKTDSNQEILEANHTEISKLFDEITSDSISIILYSDELSNTLHWVSRVYEEYTNLYERIVVNPPYSNSNFRSISSTLQRYVDVDKELSDLLEP